MTIIRREHKAHFTIVPNAVFVDTRFSVEAKGVLGSAFTSAQMAGSARTCRTHAQGRPQEAATQRFVAGHRFGDLDYVVRDVPVALTRPMENSTVPRGRKGPAAPRVQKGPVYKNSPQVQNRPAYKETYKNGESEPPGLSQVKEETGLAARQRSALDVRR